ncbi:hypothetical protein GGR58DRAFT_477876 [Xylaria digitata]|nr:hypothetical protein GGR58DRAFT_477876 [Xylaria digitata]
MARLPAAAALLHTCLMLFTGRRPTMKVRHFGPQSSTEGYLLGSVLCSVQLQYYILCANGIQAGPSTPKQDGMHRSLGYMHLKMICEALQRRRRSYVP